MRTVKNCVLTFLGTIVLAMALASGVQGDDGPTVEDLTHHQDQIQRTLSLDLYLNGTDPTDAESDLTPVLEYLTPDAGGWPLWTNATTDSIMATALSQDGAYLMAGASDGKLQLYGQGSSTPDWIAELGDAVYGVAISATGDHCVAGSADKNVYLFEKGSSTPLWNFTGGAAIYSVTMAHNGTYLAAGAADGMVYLFNRDSSDPVWQYDVGSAANSVALSADGAYLVAGTSDSEVVLFQRDNSTPLWNYTTSGKIFSVDISDDGAYLTAGSNDRRVYLFQRDDPIPVWSHDTGGGVSSVSISANGTLVTAGSYDNKIYLFDSDSSTPLWSYDTQAQVKSVALSASGDYLAAGTAGNQVMLFAWDNSTPMAVQETQGIVWTVAISGDGEYLAAGADDPVVLLCRTPWESGYVSDTLYDGDHWRVTFTPDAVAPFGNYSFRARLVNTTGGHSQAFHLLQALEVVNRIPTAHIDLVVPSPANEGDTVNFSGHGVDDGTLTAYAWRSSLDGALSSTYNFSAAGLSVGVHTLYFSVRDDQDRWSPEASSSLRVNNVLPNATIESITPGTVLQGEAVTLNGSGADVAGSIVSYRWRSSLDGNLSTLSYFTISNLSVGNHTIFFAVQDDESSWSLEVNATLTVNNTPPVAYIDTIEPSPVIFGFAVNFLGHGLDPFENVTEYRWRSSLDGVFSSEDNFTYSALSAGNHTIFFSVRDNSSQWSNEVSTLLVVNRYPTARIVSVTPSPANQDENVTFIGNGTDPEGYIAGYEWQSTLDGVFGTQRVFTNASLTPGDHLISLKVHDEHGLWSSPAITTLHINARPTASILSITPALAGLGDPVTLTGKGQDPGDTIAVYRWESSADGYLGGGSELELSNLSAGAHNITLRVQDDGGAWSDPVWGELYVNLGPEVLGVDASATVEVNKPITFKVRVSEDDGQITHYKWDVDGDQKFDITLTENETTTTFPLEGTYTLWVKVRDDRETWSEPFAFNVTVVPATPVEPEPEPEEVDDDEDGFLPGPGLIMFLSAFLLALAVHGTLYGLSGSSNSSRSPGNSRSSGISGSSGPSGSFRSRRKGLP